MVVFLAAPVLGTGGAAETATLLFASITMRVNEVIHGDGQAAFRRPGSVQMDVHDWFGGRRMRDLVDGGRRRRGGVRG